MRLGTWNVRSFCRADSQVVVVVRVRWEGSGTEPAVDYTFFYGEGSENHELGTGVFFFFFAQDNHISS
jgi:hypothetical protein